MNKKLLHSTLLKISFLFSLCIFSTMNAQVNVTVNGSANWVGFANVFNLSGGYEFGNAWALADLKSVVNPANNTVTLYPNFNTYEAGNAYWANGAIGNKTFEANTYVESAALAGQTVTFSGTVISNTLDAAYTNVAFIKGLNPANNYSTDVLVTAPLTAGQPFSITATSIPAGLVVQYGFKISGLNANPTAEAALGNVVVGAASLGIAGSSKAKLTLYPNPAHNNISLLSESTIEEVTVHTMLGQKVLDVKTNISQNNIDISGLSSGVYVINATSNGKTITQRFIKQ